LAVALINDCKYGYDARDGKLRITLLKSGIHPFAEADRETHRVRYGITVAHGGAPLTTIARRAEAFSHPLRAIPTGRHPDARPVSELAERTDAEGLFRCDAPSIAVHAIIPGETPDEIFVRLVEEGNRPVRVSIAMQLPIRRARRVDLLNRHEADIDFDEEGLIHLTFKPFEIQTLAIAIKRDGH
jgi:alpha-mannosidase